MVFLYWYCHVFYIGFNLRLLTDLVLVVSNEFLVLVLLCSILDAFSIGQIELIYLEISIRSILFFQTLASIDCDEIFFL